MYRIAALMGCTACWTAEPPAPQTPAPPAETASRPRRVASPRHDPPDGLLSAADAPNLTSLPDEAAAIASCDELALVQLGRAEVGRGNHAHAFFVFDRAFSCSTSPQIAVYAYMAACNARNEITARKYFGLLAASKQATYAQICIRNGIAVPVP